VGELKLKKEKLKKAVEELIKHCTNRRSEEHKDFIKKLPK
jgi:hypothetical protein